MLQLVIWMLCVYLVLKGKELRLIAAASPAETRESSERSAKMWEIVAYVAAILFFILSIAQGNSFPAAPRF